MTDPVLTTVACAPCAGGDVLPLLLAALFIIVVGASIVGGWLQRRRDDRLGHLLEAPDDVGEQEPL